VDIISQVKFVLPSNIDTRLSSRLHDENCENSRIIQQQFWRTECDTLGSKYTLTPPAYFQGARTPKH